MPAKHVPAVRIKLPSAMVAAAFLGGFHLLAGQDSANVEKLSPGYRFADGIYLNFTQVKNNDPVPKANLLIAEDYVDRDFFLKILSVPGISYTETGGEPMVIESSSVFGFSADGVLYIRKGKFFSRQILSGAICLFSGDYGLKTDNAGVHGGGERNSRRQIRKELQKIEVIGRQSFILDFRTGRVQRYTSGNLGSILKGDEALYTEYKTLPRQTRKKLMFDFIGKFNEKNPVYLPADK